MTLRSLRKTRSFVAVAVLAAGSPVLASGAVMRHLKLVRSFPASDTVLVTSPEKITIELSEAVELTGAKLTLAKQGGAPIALGALRREPSAPKVLRADVPTTLGSGSYAVSWRTMSKDGHVVKGTFGFRVGAAK
ncbi:copper resistance protein CopC [Gemmatimonas sp.]|uniref:copper resistance CopC family protein n=1 Tax=Gemmatimonas sp. TaxID=1962908 RepID=UPI003569B617